MSEAQIVKEVGDHVVMKETLEDGTQIVTVVPKHEKKKLSPNKD